VQLAAAKPGNIESRNRSLQFVRRLHAELALHCALFGMGSNGPTI
jgi:hypothetical protein